LRNRILGIKNYRVEEMYNNMELNVVLYNFNKI